MHLLGDFCLSWFKRSPWKTALKLVVMQLMLSSKGQAAHTRKSLISIRLISQQFSAFYFICGRVGFLAQFLANVIVAAPACLLYHLSGIGVCCVDVSLACDAYHKKMASLYLYIYIENAEQDNFHSLFPYS